MRDRPVDVEPFVRGCAWPPARWATYPRVDPADHSRLPVDTWGTAQLPVSVRLELTGDATAIVIDYETVTDDFGYRGPSAGCTFAAYAGDRLVSDAKAELGTGRVELALGDRGDADRWTIYLPEGMKPTVRTLEAVGGSIAPAPLQPRWVCYGDSIAEGWVASSPAAAWPAVASRRLGLDVVNLGYAGAARGEIASAEQVASLPADVISISHGTNCWTRTPHSTDQMRANTAAFLAIVRAAHPETPIVVATPVLRPDAESTANKLGADLRGLRAAMRDAAAAAGVPVVEGADLLTADRLPDGIHPDDEGHRILADVFGRAIAAAVGR